MMKMNMMNLSMMAPSPTRSKANSKSGNNISIPTGSKEGSRNNSKPPSRNESVDKVEENKVKETVKPPASPMTPKLPVAPKTPTQGGSGTGGKIFRPSRRRNGSKNSSRNNSAAKG